jgi:hypothetical protein
VEQLEHSAERARLRKQIEEKEIAAGAVEMMLEGQRATIMRLEQEAKQQKVKVHKGQTESDGAAGQVMRLQQEVSRLHQESAELIQNWSQDIELMEQQRQELKARQQAMEQQAMEQQAMAQQQSEGRDTLSSILRTPALLRSSSAVPSTVGGSTASTAPLASGRGRAGRNISRSVGPSSRTSTRSRVGMFATPRPTSRR